MRGLSVALSTVLCLLACSGSRGVSPSRGAPQRAAGAEGVDASAQSLSNEPDAAEATPSAPAAGPVAITAAARRAAPSAAPRVSIRAPTSGSTLRENRVELRLDVQGWRDVASAADMRHAVVALDAEPPRRVDDPARPVVFENLADGTHVARVFLAWEDHQCLAAPVAETVFHVGRASRDAPFDPAAPALVLLRPDGELTGDEAERVPLEYHLRNAPEGAVVRVRLDGAEPIDLTSAEPHEIANLSNGAHTVAAQLVGPDGAPVDRPGARAERRFLVRRARR
ncbi:MAG: hypothetical protein R3A48_24175 [Polyangiales bacterium]